MPLKSMTGFARTEGNLDRYAWIWEIRSVNAKGLDIRFRWASGFETLDMPVRTGIQNKFKRGNFAVVLTVRAATDRGSYRVNQEFLSEILDMIPALQEKVPHASPPSVDGLLGLRGVIEQADGQLDEDAMSTLTAQMMADFDAALAGLAHARQEEGLRLLAVLRGQVDDIKALIAAAQEESSTQPAAIKARLSDQLARLAEENTGIDPDRLAQEAAILTTKADIREELDRLAAHVQSAYELLSAEQPIGRKIDFLCQEFNREANTLCSKSSSVELTRIGLDLKAVIDQLREQVQNIE